MFATVRLRHRRTKGSGSRNACLGQVFKLSEAAAKSWRKPGGSKLVQDLIRGAPFMDGSKVEIAHLPDAVSTVHLTLPLFRG
ncbi:MAG: hypothetical protein CSA62_03285 [Planctomycetota bacterium]|nr:MAG: hypothetical protein CSA62_03285 [Planctomycetota bacterium]